MRNLSFYFHNSKKYIKFAFESVDVSFIRLSDKSNNKL